MTEKQVFERFILAVNRAGGQRRFADLAGVTPSYVNDLVNKRRALSDRILEVIGVRRVTQVTYEDEAARAANTSGAPPAEDRRRT